MNSPHPTTTEPGWAPGAAGADIEIAGHRIHYVTAGTGAPILFVHGNPTSSYYWRNVMPPVAAATGRRGIAIDLLGFGQSAKPRGLPYTCDLHADLIEAFIKKLDLRDVVLVAEDWGGPLAMRAVVRMPDRFEHIVLMETFLWTFTWVDDFEPKFRTPYRMMRGPLGFVFVQLMNMMIRKLIPEHCPISPEGMRRYLDDTATIESRRAMLEFTRLLPLEGQPVASTEFMDQLRVDLAALHHPVTWLKATPGVIPSDDYPPALQRLENLRSILPDLRIRDFGPGHHYLSEERPERVVELLTETLLDPSSSG